MLYCTVDLFVSISLGMCYFFYDAIIAGCNSILKSRV